MRNLGVLCEMTEVDSRYQVPDDVIKEDLAHQMVSLLLKHDLIEFRRSPVDGHQIRYAMTGTLLVAPRKTASNFEEFAKDRAGAVAREVVDEAGRQISNWGSHFGHSDILKQDANRLMGEAMRSVLNRLGAWKST